MRKGNISIFVPHVGCPCQCSFCDQKAITGSIHQPTPNDVYDAVKLALKKGSFSYEIAFFGGSFTAIERNYMVSLLEAAYKYVENGQVDGIRISTRPDMINEDVLKLLLKYGVTTIELGAQSMDDDVLNKNRRGHTAADVKKAAEQIHSMGFSLGLQMMTGLYGDNDEKAIHTAEKLIALKPDCVRIYPTVVLKNTYLAELFNSGDYKAQTLDEAVMLCAKLVPMFETAGIKVIRLGLHSEENVKKNMIDGAFHDSFGELVYSKIMLEKMLNKKPGKYTVYINSKTLSKFYGNKKQNLLQLCDAGYEIKTVIDNNVLANDMRIEHGIKIT